MTWRPGQTITRREVLHGEPWMDHPVTVLAEADRVVAQLDADERWWSAFDGWAPTSSP